MSRLLFHFRDDVHRFAALIAALAENGVRFGIEKDRDWLIVVFLDSKGDES